MRKFNEKTIDGKLDGDEKVVLTRSEYERLVREASYDGLTGLVNAYRFEEQLRHDVSVARRDILKGGKTDNLVLVYIDLNGLKHVNDNYGHEKGNELLKDTANLLYNFLKRESDTVARIGGDEFAAILPQTDIESARETVYRLQEGAKRMGILFAAGMASYQLSVNDPINGVQYERNLGDVIAELKDKADKDMYQNKGSTKRRTSVERFYDQRFRKEASLESVNAEKDTAAVYAA